MGHRPKVSPTIFIATILCFLFPFITISCGGQKVATFSGVQLATGTSVSQPQMFGPPQKKDVAPEPLAALAALCTIVGLALSFLPSKAALGPAISGGVGALFLFLLKSKMDDQIVKQGQGMLQANYEAGFTLSLLLLVAGAAWNAYLFFSQRAETAAPSLSSTAHPPGQLASPAASPSPPSAVICPHCGVPMERAAKFCAGCGEPLSASAKARQNQL